MKMNKSIIGEYPGITGASLGLSTGIVEKIQRDITMNLSKMED